MEIVTKDMLIQALTTRSVLHEGATFKGTVSNFVVYDGFAEA